MKGERSDRRRSSSERRDSPAKNHVSGQQESASRDADRGEYMEHTEVTIWILQYGETERLAIARG